MDPTLSALVVLRPAGGELEGAITSERAAELEPDADVAVAVERYFRERGFDVAARVALSFAITAPQSVFETVFGARLSVEGAGTVTTARTEAGGVELPLVVLPAEIADAVQAVTFTPPPDFGPTRFGP